MTLAVRGSVTSGSQASGSSFTVAAPTGLSAGDVILIFTCALSGSIGTLAGFTGTPEAVASAFHARAFTRIADGTESSTFTITSAGTPGAALCAAFSGAGNPDPVSPAACFVSSSNGATLPVPGVLLSYGGDWLVWFGASMRNASTTPGTVAVPAGYAALGNTGAVTGATESCYIACGGLETSQSPGGTGTQTGTPSISVPRSGWLTGVSVSGAALVITPGVFAGIPF